MGIICNDVTCMELLPRYICTLQEGAAVQGAKLFKLKYPQLLLS